MAKFDRGKFDICEFPRLRRNFAGDVYLEVVDADGDRCALEIECVRAVWICDKGAVINMGFAQFTTKHSYEVVMDLLAPIQDGEV